MEKITRQDAIERGLLRYFTGRSCIHGHVSERHTSSSTCIECLKLAKEVERKKIRARKAEVRQQPVEQS